MHFLSENKRNILVPKLFDFAEFFYFAHLPLHFYVQTEKESFVKLFVDGM